MKPKKSPAFSAYAKDFVADTIELSAEQVGAYWLLLCHAWIGLKGFEQCFLPDDDARLAKLARVPPAKWQRIGGEVRKFFETDGKGALFSRRLLEELAKQRERSRKATDKANERWHPALSKSLRSGEFSADRRMPQHQSSNASDADEDAVENEDANSERKEREKGEVRELRSYLRALVRLYPETRLGEIADVDRALEAVAHDLPHDPIDFAFGVWRWSRSEDWQEQAGRFIPSAEKFLKKRRWRESPRSCTLLGLWAGSNNVADELRAAVAEERAA